MNKLLDAHFLNDRLETAIHEAGHAVTAFCSGATVTSATIENNGMLDGWVAYSIPIIMSIAVRDSIYAAGFTACVLYDEKYDLASETRSQRHQVEATGDWPNLQGDAYTAVAHAARVLKQNWYRVEALAVALLDHQTLSGAQVANILHTARQPVPSQPVPSQPVPSFADFVPKTIPRGRAKGTLLPKAYWRGGHSRLRNLIEVPFYPIAVPLAWFFYAISLKEPVG